MNRNDVLPAVGNLTNRAPAATSVERVLITKELERRTARPRDASSEEAAYAALARAIAASPAAVPRRLVELTLELCRAGTAGVSLLDTGTAPDDRVLRWVALAGAYAHLEGGTVSEAFSPCGQCLRHDGVQLYSRPARAFEYLSMISPPIVECLVVPLRSPSGLLGTLWVISHQDDHQFTWHDAKVLQGLADVTATVLALQRDRDDADAASRAQRELLAFVSHELRTRLTALVGWSSVLLSGRATPALAAKAIERIHLNARRQASIVEALAADAHDVQGEAS